MIKILSSKNHPAGNRDYWWYNLSSPDDWIRHDTQINLVLYDESNETNIGTIILQLDRNDWYSRVMRASRHTFKGRRIIKVHVIKEFGNPQYYIYFGKIDDGYYLVNVESNKIVD